MALNNLCNYMPLKNTGVACSPAIKGSAEQLIMIYMLFSQPMVKAIWDKSKTLTRRMVTPQPIFDNDSGYVFDGKHKNCYKNDMHHVPWQDAFIAEHSPYKPGWYICVKETHYRFGRWAVNGTTKKGKPRWEFYSHDSEVRYWDNPPKEFRVSVNRDPNQLHQWYKRPSMFMPFTAARNFLQIKTVRIEQLQDITEADAIREGIQQMKDSIIGPLYKDYLADPSGHGDPDHDFPCTGYPLYSFETLWKKINGEDSWNQNPWVWVVEFEKIILNIAK